MSSFHSVVTEQKVFICAVCSFIGNLIRAVLPDVAWDNAFLQSEDELNASLDDVIKRQSLEGSNEGDCCLAMAQTACRKLKRVCDLLKIACSSVGLKDIAGKYLDAPWFTGLLLRKDTSKLNKLYYTIDFTDDKPSRILMNVAAILENRTAGYDAMLARAKRKADRETKELIKKVGEDVKSLHGKIDAHDTETKKQFAAVRNELHETKEELLAKADAILRKSGKMNSGGKRKGKHTIEQKKICLACWMQAQENVTLKSGTNTGKPTHDAAFVYYRRELATVGVESAAKFKSVIHAVQSANSAENIKQLEAKIEAARKAKKTATANTRSKKCGIIHAMKRTTRSALMLAAAVGALAASCAQGAVLPALPEAAYADTEVSTNVPFNVARSDAREFGVEMSFAGTASNCVQIAFGRDADGDGALSPEETALALGWRRGAYFIEGGGARTYEAADAEWTGARRLSLRVGLDGAFRPRAVGATNETGACFAQVAEAAAPWLYGADWNMMRVTRRGVDAPGETLAVECLYRFFYISIR